MANEAIEIIDEEEIDEIEFEGIDEADHNMKWNYRIICTDEHGFAFHECFYEDDLCLPESLPDSWAGSPAEPFGDSPDELIQDLLKFNRAAKMPILYEIGGDLMEI